jgi:uncharacterized protein
MHKLLSVVLMFIPIPAVSLAASFDCSKARLPAEVAICQDPELSRLDEEMARAYQAALKKGESQQLKASQRAWLKERNGCGSNALCLKRLYTARISQIKGTGVRWGISDWKRAIGKWTEAETTSMEGQWLNIKEVADRGFTFELSALSGSHTGEIEGFAAFSPQGALFKSEENDCQVEFLPLGSDRLEVETSGECWSYGGIGVGFDGQYLRGVHEKTLSLVDLGVLKSKTKDQAFHKLVGPAYKDFVERFQLPNDDNKDIDGLGARVVTGGVRGMFTIMEAILMDGPGMKVYAAMLKDDKVEYFTNDPDYARRLPKTIEAWRQHFPQASVFFMTAK